MLMHLQKELMMLIPGLVLFVVTGQNPNASTAAMAGAVEAAGWLRERYNQFKIAFVGPHINALPLQTLQTHSFIDFCFTNEGVYALQNVLKTNLSYDELKHVKGLCLRDSENKLYLTPAERIVPQEMLETELPGVAYDLMPTLDNYRTSSWHSNYHDIDRSPFCKHLYLPGLHL